MSVSPQTRWSDDPVKVSGPVGLANLGLGLCLTVNVFQLIYDDDDIMKVVYQTPIDNRRAMNHNRCNVLEKAMGRY